MFEVYMEGGALDSGIMMIQALERPRQCHNTYKQILGEFWAFALLSTPLHLDTILCNRSSNVSCLRHFFPGHNLTFASLPGLAAEYYEGRRCMFFCFWQLRDVQNWSRLVVNPDQLRPRRPGPLPLCHYSSVAP